MNDHHGTSSEAPNRTRLIDCAQTAGGFGRRRFYSILIGSAPQHSRRRQYAPAPRPTPPRAKGTTHARPASTSDQTPPRQAHDAARAEAGVGPRACGEGVCLRPRKYHCPTNMNGTFVTVSPIERGNAQPRTASSMQWASPG